MDPFWVPLPLGRPRSRGVPTPIPSVLILGISPCTLGISPCILGIPPCILGISPCILVISPCILGNLSLYTGNLSLYTGVKEDLCLRNDPFWVPQETKEGSQDKVPKSRPGPFGLISNPEQKSPESSRARACAHARARARARGSTKSYLISHSVLEHFRPVFCLFSFHRVLARFWDTPNT